MNPWVFKFHYKHSFILSIVGFFFSERLEFYSSKSWQTPKICFSVQIGPWSNNPWICSFLPCEAQTRPKALNFFFHWQCATEFGNGDLMREVSGAWPLGLGCRTLELFRQHTLAEAAWSHCFFYRATKTFLDMSSDTVFLALLLSALPLFYVECTYEGEVSDGPVHRSVLTLWQGNFNM